MTIGQQHIDEQAAAELAERFGQDVEPMAFDPACACGLACVTQPNGLRALVLDPSGCPVHGAQEAAA